ncbi:MAG: aminoglycoside phosphotransferase family protein [Oscillospiraceae bacterium]|nr:aminoglycoside phosphotransferase family protein [Oscillospiraceae bacterium]
MLFLQNIEDKKSWSNISQQIGAFKPLIEHILKLESLPFGDISNTEWSSNAVFKAGNLIIKIFAPKEARDDTERCYKSELFGQTRASSIGLSVPKTYASGIIKDKYDFPYIVSEFLEGVDLRLIYRNMGSNTKYALGRKLREITNRLNTPCEPFNSIDYTGGLTDEGYNGWLIDLGYQENFLDERNKYIHSLCLNKRDFVFCHGDMAPCNILYDSDVGLHIIDFASAVLAPLCVEHSYLAFWFGFNKDFMRGYFGEMSVDELVDICFNGFLLSVNGISLLASGLDFGFIDGKSCETIEDFKIQLREYIEIKHTL